MEYVLTIYDNAKSIFIMEDASVNESGVHALLENMTDLNLMGQRYFMYELINKHFAFHTPEPDDKKQYSVGAMKIGKTL